MLGVSNLHFPPWFVDFILKGTFEYLFEEKKMLYSFILKLQKYIKAQQEHTKTLKVGKRKGGGCSF